TYQKPPPCVTPPSTPRRRPRSKLPRAREKIQLTVSFRSYDITPAALSEPRPKGAVFPYWNSYYFLRQQKTLNSPCDDTTRIHPPSTPRRRHHAGLPETRDR